MSGSLGSGQVHYDPDKPLIHFATPPEDVERALLAHKLRQTGFETTERIPT